MAVPRTGQIPLRPQSGLRRSPESAGGRVWVLSELYWPEQTSTGHVMTAVAEHVALATRVEVICAQPGYDARGHRAPRTEEQGGVRITRCWATRFPKDSILGRVINAVSFTGSVYLSAVSSFRRGDRAFVVTNPPMLPFAVLLAARMRGAECVLFVHDVYPEQMIATGMVSPTSFAARLLARLSRWLYRNVDHVVVIGRDMAELARTKTGPDGPAVTVITNWSDADSVEPQERRENPLLRELGWNDKFVVQYAGNMGRPNALEAVLEAATRLRDHPDIRFLLVGSGAKRALVDRLVAERKLDNVVVRDPLPRSQQTLLLNACDVSVIPFVPGMLGLGVPSRTYNLLAAGIPIITLAHPQSEVAQLVSENALGWVVPENEPARLDDAILAVRSASPDARRSMAERARALATGPLYRDRILDRFTDLLTGPSL